MKISLRLWNGQNFVETPIAEDANTISSFPKEMCFDHEVPVGKIKTVRIVGDTLQICAWPAGAQ